MARQDQYSISISVEGRPLGIWDVMSGGEVDSEETKYRRGGMGPQVSLGGLSMTGNVTVGRLFDRLEDAGFLHWLMSMCGKGRAVVTRQPLDIDGNALGRPLVYSGKLKSVTPGEVDANSADADVYNIEVTTEGLPA